MTSNKNQLYIFKRLLDGEPVYIDSVGEEMIAVSDGVRVFVFAAMQIKFDANECIKLPTLHAIFDNADTKPRYTQTEIIRENGDKIYRMMKVARDNVSVGDEVWVLNEYEEKNGDRVYQTLAYGVNEVWVEDEFIKAHKNCVFTYSGGKSPVCALDDYGNPLAAIMPYDMDGNIQRAEAYK